MDAIKAFFQKYNAVPATNNGLSWEQASPEALIGWAESQCQAWDRGERDGILRSRMVDIGNELYRRLAKLPEEIWLGVYPKPLRSRLLAAWNAIFLRVGFQWAVVDKE